jgi:hypothetical protein
MADAAIDPKKADQGENSAGFNFLASAGVKTA